ncbi:unnamed protein product, partial [Ectocarpus sp. 4 AP-2014]
PPPPLLKPKDTQPSPPWLATPRWSKRPRFRNAPARIGCDAAAPARVLLTEDVATSLPPLLPPPAARPDERRSDSAAAAAAALAELGVTHKTKQPRVEYSANPRRRPPPPLLQLAPLLPPNPPAAPAAVGAPPLKSPPASTAAAVGCAAAASSSEQAPARVAPTPARFRFPSAFVGIFRGGGGWGSGLLFQQRL